MNASLEYPFFSGAAKKRRCDESRRGERVRPAKSRGGRLLHHLLFIQRHFVSIVSMAARLLHARGEFTAFGTEGDCVLFLSRSSVARASVNKSALFTFAFDS